MLEFLFCPQHGLFRPENIMMFMAYWTSLQTELELFRVRLFAAVGRFL